jgi:multicomponent Na+:H+ antiporter subunit A
VPLHFWLPNAMVAPTPVSAFLHSATMVKVGVYFLGRVRPLFASPEWTVLLVTVGLLTMTVCALLAVVATDLKELLAYSTASHLGLMVAGFGIAAPAGGEAGTFHLLTHALFKAPLFLVAGIVAREAGTRRIEDLGGLWRDLPVTAAIAVIAGLAMAGIPPSNGFYSKELLFAGTYELARAAGGLAWLVPAVATLASVVTVLYSLRFLAVFVGDRPDAIGAVHAPPAALVAPAAVLGGAVALVSFAPQLTVDAVLQGAVAATAPGAPELHVGPPDHLSVPLGMSAVAILGGIAAYPVLDRLRHRRTTGPRIARPPGPQWLYDRLLARTESASARLGPAVHTGALRTYVTWVVAVGSVLVLGGYAMAQPGVGLAALGVTPTLALILAVAVLAAIAVVRAESHVTGVLTLSILGFMVAIVYILASAPDLALTQLVVETLVLLIFLLVIERLPSFYTDTDPGVLARDGAVATVAGVTAFVTVLVAMPSSAGEATDLARFYVTEAVPGGGGTNVVNVILVDFRGFDTLGELVVVAIAALSVLVLVTMRSRGETQ